MEDTRADIEGTHSIGRLWILWTAISLAAALGLAIFLVGWGQGNGPQAEQDGQSGLTALYQGDYQTARRHFTQAMNEASSAEDKAGYEMLLAGSLETSAPDDAAQHYLNVIGNAALSPRTRGTVGTYLLMFLNARHDAAFTKAVFARSPWADLYQPLTSDDSLNAELAIVKAHETILAFDPNFFSYLIAGEFYARKYPYLTGGIVRFRDEYRSKATDYFPKGMALLRAARETNEWDKTRLALGYTSAIAYAVELDDALPGSLSESTIRATYLEAVGFADNNSSGEVLMESARFRIRLAYASYLASHRTPQNGKSSTTIGNELATLAHVPVNGSLVRQVLQASDASSKYGRFKPALFYMASSSPALEKVVTGDVVQ